MTERDNWLSKKGNRGEVEEQNEEKFLFTPKIEIKVFLLKFSFLIYFTDLPTYKD